LVFVTISTFDVENFLLKCPLKAKQNWHLSVILIKPRIFSSLYASVTTVMQLVQVT